MVEWTAWSAAAVVLLCLPPMMAMLHGERDDLAESIEDALRAVMIWIVLAVGFLFAMVIRGLWIYVGA